MAFDVLVRALFTDNGAAAGIAKLNSEIGKVLKQPAGRDRLAADGAEPAPDTPAEFEALIKSELVKWAKVIKSAGLAHTL